MSKPSAVLAAVLATSSMTCALPCAALPKAGSFLDRAALGPSTGLYRGVFSSAGSFHSGAPRDALFAALYAAPAPAPSPEAGTMLLAGLGLLGLVAHRRWRALRAAD